MLQLSLDRTRVGADETVEIAAIHAPARAEPHRLPGVAARRRASNLATGDAAPRMRLACLSWRPCGAARFPSDYGERLANRPARGAAPLRRQFAHRRRALLPRGSPRCCRAYAQQIAAQRLALRGVDTQRLAPMAVQDVDVATPAARAQLVLGMLSFFIMLSLLTGGMYLAIDTTVGERERGTLEPLLAAPVPRGSLLLGKLLATCCLHAAVAVASPPSRCAWRWVASTWSSSA